VFSIDKVTASKNFGIQMLTSREKYSNEDILGYLRMKNEKPVTSFLSAEKFLRILSNEHVNFTRTKLR
jgi:hypothetical protein